MTIFEQERFLFLDDIREPQDAYFYTSNDLYRNANWFVVRSYNEFVRHIQNNGLPDYISLDHDLGDEHYISPKNYVNTETLKNHYEENVDTYTEKTGYHCAEWLVNYCLDNNEKLPRYFCHSMNPVGKEKIISLLNNFNKRNE